MGSSEEAGEGTQPSCYSVPLPIEYVHFVESIDSAQFSLLIWALKNAAIIAMDAEWKPVNAKSSQHIRVSILQLAFRLRASASRDRSGLQDHNQHQGLERSFCSEQNRNGSDVSLSPTVSEHISDTVQKICKKQTPEKDDSLKCACPVGCTCSVTRPRARAEKCEGTRCEVTSCETTKSALAPQGTSTKELEFIFILDLLSVPVSSFGKELHQALVDSTILKLGFGFKQDLMNLRSTFPGPDAHGCFVKVDPYLDVGKLYKHLFRNISSFKHRGKSISALGDGLASIVESVLGVPLCKDMQCSNWEERPLSPQQYDYAAADAYCLLAVFDKLQVKASELWFLVVEEEEDEDEELMKKDEADVERLVKVGVTEVLLPRNAASSYGVSTRICFPERGNAAGMVEVALGLSRMTASGVERKALGVEKLISRFGEKLHISGRESLSKRIRRKARSRRARSGKDKDTHDEDDAYWVGPPPWDVSVGGDGTPKFLCDAMVEGLARQLRCVGIDAASLNSKSCEPRDLINLAEREGRILLTRDIKLLRRRLVPATLAYRVRRQGKWDQLAEIMETFKLSISEEQLLSRCTKCNGSFVPKGLTGEEAVARAPWNQVIPDCALRNVDEFWQCSVCQHIYWQGYQFTRAWKQFAAVCVTDSSVNHY